MPVWVKILHSSIAKCLLGYFRVKETDQRKAFIALFHQPKWLAVVWKQHLGCNIESLSVTVTSTQIKGGHSDVTLTCKMVDGAEVWISCQQLMLLRKASHWQLIQKSMSSTVLWHQCDIRIRLSKGIPQLPYKPSCSKSQVKGLTFLCRPFDG